MNPLYRLQLTCDREDIYYHVSHLFTFLDFIRLNFFFCETIRKPFLANIYETPLHIVVVATSHLLAKGQYSLLEKDWERTVSLATQVQVRPEELG
jgi:hypothetical protein